LELCDNFKNQQNQQRYPVKVHRFINLKHGQEVFSGDVIKRVLEITTK
jgi:hypothetical protein